MSEIITDLPRASGNASGLHVTKKLMSLTLKSEYQKYQAEVVKKMMNSSIEMAQNPYGNYAIQIALDCYNQELVIGIIQTLRGKIPQLSITKYSSNVIEKCLEKSEGELRAEIIHELASSDNAFGLMKNKFGNFVIQKAFVLGDHKSKEELIAKLQQSLPFLPNKGMKASWSKIIEDFKKSEMGSF